MTCTYIAHVLGEQILQRLPHRVAFSHDSLAPVVTRAGGIGHEGGATYDALQTLLERRPESLLTEIQWVHDDLLLQGERNTENRALILKKVLNLPVLLPLLLKIVCSKILSFNISLQNERGEKVRFMFSHTKCPTSQELNGCHYWLCGLNRILESISLDAEAQAVIFINWTNQ